MLVAQHGPTLVPLAIMHFDTLAEVAQAHQAAQ